MVEGRRLCELKYVGMIHVLRAVGPKGRVGILLCIKTAAIEMNA